MPTLRAGPLWIFALALLACGGPSAPAERAANEAPPPPSNAPGADAERARQDACAAEERGERDCGERRASDPPAWIDACSGSLRSAWLKARTKVPDLKEATVERLGGGIRYGIPGTGEITVEEGPKAEIPEWYWPQDDPSGMTMKRGHGNLSAYLKGFEEGPAYWIFRHAADACLAAVVPVMDFESPDGTILEDQGVQAVQWGDGVLIVGEFFAGLIERASDGSLRLSPFEMPEGMPRGTTPEGMLGTFECGDGERVLVMSGFVGAPASYWRFTSAGWSGEGEVSGGVVGCGPGWTLLVRTPHESGTVRYIFETVGDTARRPAPRQTSADKGGICADGPGGRAFWAAPSGHVISAGRRCGTDRRAVEMWSPGQRRGRIVLLRDVPVLRGRGDHADHLFDPGYMLSPDGTAIVLDGKSFKRIKPPFEDTVIIAGNRGTALFYGPYGLARREPDGSFVSAPRPHPRHPDATRAEIYGAAITPDGDAWIGWWYMKADCGRRFVYHAITETKSASFVER